MMKKPRVASFKLFLRILSAFYFLGALLHLADLCDLRLHFSTMTRGWKVWIVYLFVADIVAALGLWKSTYWGINAFLLVAISQLVAYVFFPNFFGWQIPLILFHILTLAIYFGFYRKANRLAHWRQGIAPDVARD